VGFKGFSVFGAPTLPASSKPVSTLNSVFLTELLTSETQHAQAKEWGKLERVVRAINLITLHKQFGKFPPDLTRHLRSVDEKGFGVAERREGFARLARVCDLGGFPI